MGKKITACVAEIIARFWEWARPRATELDTISQVNNLASLQLPQRLPAVGELVFLRSRRWLVEGVVEAERSDQSARIRLACAEEDSQGELLEIYWDLELDRKILEQENWDDLGSRGFDSPAFFGAFYNTLNWSCVTATDPTLFQAPFRAGIKVDAYQMEPLRKALLLPRVNLFIADDTGLGKTIEAGLIARELLLRKKAKTIVVAAPPSVIEQWKGELEERFGLVFEILDREYLTRMRRVHGFGVNPWRTHSRFLVSHRLLIDEAYTAPMREWLGPFLAGSLLILDEAHHAAPASGNKYGIETKFTRAVRNLAGRFEHRLFLSATPHNGHSSSFSTLLEILDPYRFTRGVKVRGKKILEDVMIRRLKEDIREIQGGFPRRLVSAVVIDNLPDDAPELLLSRLLDKYRTVREERHNKGSNRSQAASGLLVIGLQQRLLSSTEAFARTLKTHRATVLRQWEKGGQAGTKTGSGASFKQDSLELLATVDADDERASWSPDELDAAEEAAIERVAAEAEEGGDRDKATLELWQQEQDLLDQMEKVSESARYDPDAKMRRLIEWIREQMCPNLPEFGAKASGTPASWNDRRVLIFTENREGTKKRLLEIVKQAIESTDQAENRIAVIDGLTRGDRRKEIQRRFNTVPSKDPLRILIATDAAREGLNFQAHCADLFHFDLPWNPGRLEQRNGRIDRKLQPADEVRCHYFVLPQRVEDRVLEVLVQKTETIKKELGSLSKVIENDIEGLLNKGGIRHADAKNLADEVQDADLDEERKRITEEELEASRDRQDDLKDQVERCQTLLEKSRKWVGFEAKPFRDALSCSLQIINAEPLEAGRDADGKPIWTFPPLDRAAEADPSWAATLDTLRTPRKPNQKLAEWRREAPIRPVIFEDAGVLSDEKVHLHLEQRVAHRLLARFRSQGFVHNDLSRACLAQTDDSIPRIVLIGRLSLYGKQAERLHEEIVLVAARWVEPDRRNGPLKAYARDAEGDTRALLEGSLRTDRGTPIAKEVQERLLASAKQDINDLLPLLKPRAEELIAIAVSKLAERGQRESKQIEEILTKQRDRVRQSIEKADKDAKQGKLQFGEGDKEEKRQFEANVRSWHERNNQFDQDLKSEPTRIKEFYEVRAQRVEPIGLVYLWPESN